MVFQKNKNIRSKREFDLIYKKGKFFSGRFFSLRVLPQENKKETRFAIVIGLKISKKAVLRNRKKRQLREIVRLNYNRIKPGYLFLIVAKRSVLDASYHDLEKEFVFLCKKAEIIHD